MTFLLLNIAHLIDRDSSFIKVLVARKPVFRVSDQSDTIRDVQPQKMARGLKLRIEGLHYL